MGVVLFRLRHDSFQLEVAEADFPFAVFGAERDVELVGRRGDPEFKRVRHPAAGSRKRVVLGIERLSGSPDNEHEFSGGLRFPGGVQP
ncbi:hypothetical protein SDC9_152761 [bioreactor metagenome]|uniref:Uncharacterized protein n=1 Tax=bioreactor metagenome TaxID=1076179 RepID=A0A645EVP8_9ZZZZ